MKEENISEAVANKEIMNGSPSLLMKYWEYLTHELGSQLGQYFVKLLYAFYMNFTFPNVVRIIFFINQRNCVIHPLSNLLDIFFVIFVAFIFD